MTLVDLSNVEEASFNVLPAGHYELYVDEAEVKDTKAGTGQYIKVKFRVAEGQQFQNRVLFHNFNIANPNPEAVQFGLAQLKSMMLASGVKEEKAAKLESVQDLYGLKFIGVVKVKQSEQYGEQNELIGFKPITQAQTKAKNKAEIDTSDIDF